MIKKEFEQERVDEMNLNELFSIQAELDKRIVEEHELQGQDLLDMKILALQVEVGELANEWRGFKFWSKDQEPRTRKLVNGDVMKGEYEYSNPILEEYVDCFHFILSIGLEKGFEKKTMNLSAAEGMKRKDITSQFNYLFDKIGDFSSITNHNNYMYIIPLFIGLGEMLGFTQEQIEQAYLDKNQINHNRQDAGY